MILFQQRAITEITSLDKQVKESRKRELEWKELADLFGEYRNKMTSEIDSMREVIDQYKDVKEQLSAQLSIKERENMALMDELGLYKVCSFPSAPMFACLLTEIVLQDLIIRVEALKRRRQNVEKLSRQLDADENAFMDILQGVRSLPSMIDLKDKDSK
jgi:hypothetical protein